MTVEYLYDFPMPSTSSHVPTTPLPKRDRRRRHRSTSPPTPAARNQRAEMIRLLDPSYTSSQDISYYEREQAHAIVDPCGNLHDPDYRPFPAIIVREPSSSKYGFEHGALRSTWSDDDEDDEDRVHLGVSKRIQTKRPSTLNAKPTSRTSPSWYPTDLPSLTATNSQFTYSSSSSSSAPSPLSVATPFEDAEPPHRHRVLVRKSVQKAREEHFDFDEEEEEQAPQHRRVSEDIDEALAKEELERQQDFEESAKQPEWTPSCKYQLRREIAAVRMHLSFKLYRLKKGVSRTFGVAN